MALKKTGKVATHAHVSAGAATGDLIDLSTVSPTPSYVLIQNDGAVAVYLNLAGGAAVVHRGVLIAAGGSFELTAEKGDVLQHDIKIITASSTADILITTI